MHFERSVSPGEPAQGEPARHGSGRHAKEIAIQYSGARSAASELPASRARVTLVVPLAEN
jgi:hypothetical protein